MVACEHLPPSLNKSGREAKFLEGRGQMFTGYKNG